MPQTWVGVSPAGWQAVVPRWVSEGGLARWRIGQEITAVRVAPYLPLGRHRLMGHQA